MAVPLAVTLSNGVLFGQRSVIDNEVSTLYIIVIGCGKVGRQLLDLLSTEQHYLVAIDRQPAALDALGPDFPGLRIAGNGIDTDLLEQKAGVRDADAVVAVTGDDNTNLVIAQLARTKFGVGKVLARLFDLDSRYPFADLGIYALSPAVSGAVDIRNFIEDVDFYRDTLLYNLEIELVRLRVKRHLAGVSHTELEVDDRFRVIAIVRDNRALLPVEPEELRRTTWSSPPFARAPCKKSRGLFACRLGAHVLMYVVIVGGGKVGYHLAKLTKSNGHEVTIIEVNPQRSQYLAEDLQLVVICGDGSRRAILEEAETGRADVFVAVTGADQNNIIACQLAKRLFGVRRTIARINNPKNDQLVTELGVDVGVSSTAIIGRLIEHELLVNDLKTLLAFEQGRMVLVQVRIDSGSRVAGRTVMEVGQSLPENALLVAILRSGQTIVPRGHTTLLAGDEVIALTNTEHTVDIERLFAR